MLQNRLKLVWGIVQKEIETDDIDNSYSDGIKLLVKELLSKVSFKYSYGKITTIT